MKERRVDGVVNKTESELLKLLKLRDRSIEAQASVLFTRNVPHLSFIF